MTGCSYSEIKGKSTLITGDIGSGKTVLTRRLLKEAVMAGEDITVVDFAPPAQMKNDVKVGGYLVEDEADCRLLRSRSILTPRISAEDSDELIKLADINLGITEGLLAEFIKAPTPVLFVNDTSIHLQRGELAPIIEAIEKAETAVLNGYVGDYLKADHGTGVSERERVLMQKLAEAVDREIRL